MTITLSKKHVLTALLLTASLGITSLWAQTGSSTVPAPVPQPPANLPGPNDPIATINGRDINVAAFNSILMQVAGWRVFRPVFDLTLVQGACAAEGISIQGDDFEKRIREEYQHTLETMGVGPDVTDDQRPKVLDLMLARSGTTLIEFRIILETRAGLRAMAQNSRIDAPTDEEIRDLYNSRFGKKVAIKIFAIGNDSATGAKLRDAIEKKGLSPELAAASANIGQPQSVTIPENAKGDEIKDIKQMAFSTKEHQLSLPFDHTNPTDKKSQTIMVYVDKIYPEDPVRYENAKPEVKKTFHDLVVTTKENEWMDKRLNLLRVNAVVDIKDPYLRQQYNAIAAQMNASPASQPAIPGVPDITPTTMNGATATNRAATRP